MRETKLFNIGVNNILEANELKEKLDNLEIEEIEDGIDMSYSGFITCNIAQQDGNTELIVYTFLKLEEFQDIVLECAKQPKIFQYERKEII